MSTQFLSNSLHFGKIFFGKEPVRLATGVYLSFSHNGEMFLPHEQQRPYEFTYPHEVSPLNSAYGVCDNFEQILGQAPICLFSDEEKYVIFLCSVKRENEPEKGGWRWHKWGHYIGNHKPQHEYLYDEKDIDEVFCYHIYRLLDDEVKK